MNKVTSEKSSESCGLPQDYRNINKNLLALSGICMHRNFLLFLLEEPSDFFIDKSREISKAWFFQLSTQEMLTGSVFKQNRLQQVISAARGDILLLSSVVKEQEEIPFFVLQLHSFHAIIPFFSLEDYY